MAIRDEYQVNRKKVERAIEALRMRSGGASVEAIADGLGMTTLQVSDIINGRSKYAKEAMSGLGTTPEDCKYQRYFKIFSLWREGVTMEDIAREAGIHHGTPWRILYGSKPCYVAAREAWEKAGNPPIERRSQKRGIGIRKIERAFKAFELNEKKVQGKDIAKELGCCPYTVSQIINGRGKANAEALRLWMEKGNRNPKYCHHDDLERDFDDEGKAMIKPARHQGEDLDGYVACATGRVGSLHEGRYIHWLSSNTTKTQPYPIIKLRIRGEEKTKTVHSIIAETFLGDRPEGLDVCHADHDKENPAVFNLYYATTQHNMDESRKAGHFDKVRKHSTELLLEVFRLRDEEHMTFKAIAEELNIPNAYPYLVYQGEIRKEVKKEWERLLNGRQPAPASVRE